MGGLVHQIHSGWVTRNYHVRGKHETGHGHRTTQKNEGDRGKSQSMMACVLLNK
jgi:hypothetical protein